MVIATEAVVVEVEDLKLVTEVAGEEAAEEEVGVIEMSQLKKNANQSKHQKAAPIHCPAKSTTTNVSA